MTTLLVTHDQAEALSFADTIAVMRSGLLVQVGEPQEVYDNPIDLSTADFIGDTCTVRGTILGDTASGPFGDIAVRRPPDGSVVDGPALLMFRPEQLRIHHGNSHGIPSIIHSVAYFGHDCVVTAELCGDGSAPRATVTCRLLGADRLEAGDRVRIGVIGPALAYPLPQG